MPDYPDMRKKDNRDLLTKVKDRYKLMYEDDDENRRNGQRDMEFTNVPGKQWQANMKQERGKRPCWEFNKIRVKAKRVINAMRAERPGVKVTPTEEADKQGAELREGLIRNIWSASNANHVIDYAAEYQVAGGMAAWRVNTKYATDDTFDQDIVVESIQNPFTVYCDPACKDLLKRDAMDWLITTRIPKEEFEDKYPKADQVDFESVDEFDTDDHDWKDEDAVRIAEYWYKVPHEKELFKLQTGEVVDSESDEGLAILQQPDLIAQRRTIQTHKIKYLICSGERILEGPFDWAGREFPFVMVYGDFVQIKGENYWCGLTRWAKDAQRSYNVSRTAIAETIAQAPLSKWWATDKQAKGHVNQWKEAHKKNFPFLLYSNDPSNPGPPTRMGGADIPVALMQEAQIASDELKDVTGIYDASMGARSNETSGRAIFARQSEGEIATFNFQANMEAGIQRTYEILLDLIPEIYDTERELRVLGSDGAEEYFRVNQVVQAYEKGPDGVNRPKMVRVHDLSAGKYDINLVRGPSYSTKRQEAAETYTALVQQLPDVMGVAGDLIFKSMDYPYAEEIAERLRFMLPPAIQQSLNKDMPPEIASMMAQAESAVQQAQAMMGEAEQAKAEAEKEIARVDKGKSEMGREQANIEKDMAMVQKAKAEFDKHMAEQMIKLMQMKLDIAPILEAGEDYEATKEQLQDVSMLVENIDQILATFMRAADEAVESIQEQADREIIDGGITREGGDLVARVIMTDGTEKTVRGRRDGASMRIVPPEAL